MTALIMIVSLTPLMMVTGVVVGRYKAAYQAKTVSHLEELVQKNARMVDTFLQERLRNISFLARSCDCEDLADPDFLNNRLMDFQNEYPNVFQDMGFVNEQGFQMAYAGSYHLEHAQYSDANWFKQAVTTDRYISDAFLGLRGFPHCIVTVTKRCNGEKWVLRATIDFSAFSSMVEKLRIGRSGYAFIVNKKGEFQTRRPEAYTENAPHLTDVKSQESDPLILTAPLKSGAWRLVVMQKRADALGDLQKTHKIAFAALFFGLVSSMVTAIYVPALIFSKMTIKR